ncbi:hypothetical protein [Maribellus mangrovi]|uniref:hypothetical protein n=1 Tax=Maribellus mangrovi TaxID=3133146 RepID=UPI0030EC5304
MDKPKVYCELDFYTKFLKSIPDTNDLSEDKIHQLTKWITINNFISKSNLQIDTSVSNFHDLCKTQPWMLRLWKKSANGECDIDFNSSDFPNLEKFEDAIATNANFLSSIFLSTVPSGLCNEIEKNYGVKVFSIESLYENLLLSSTHIETIDKGTKSHSNWDFLSIFKHPCNTLILVDNYLLKNIDDIENNLIDILDKIIPVNLKIPFHISIFTKSEHNNTERLEKIKKNLSKLRPSINFKITIHKLNGEFHDRTLLTNYLILESGIGFDLFTKRGAKQQTRILGYFLWTKTDTNQDIPSTHEMLVKSLKKIFNNSCSTPYLTNYWGDNENRLFEA